MPKTPKTSTTRGGRSQRHRDRLTTSGDAVLSLAVATELLPIHDGDARLWLRGRGLVRDLAGRAVVVWGDVVAEIRSLPTRR